MAANDCKSVERAAHTLRGSMSNFAPKIAIQSAAELERMGRAGDLKGAEVILRRMEKEVDVLQSALMAMTNQNGRG